MLYSNKKIKSSEIKDEEFMILKRAILVLCFVFSVSSFAQMKNKYDVLEGRPDTLQKRYFLDRLQTQFDLRREKAEKSFESKEKIYERQKELRSWYKKIVGKLPAKGPLNIVVTKKKEFENYLIEWVAFESFPNHHVTGLFYLPKNGRPPYPGVYIPCGHSSLGKGQETYQKAARLFAMNGFAALVTDPICQGERFQYLNKEGEPATRGGTLMHEILNQALLLTGSNILLHELYDNIRGLDFLEQYPLVDKNRLIVAGNSGGGTQVTYLAAFDERAKVIIPSCYIATTENKLKTIGSQDGCQQLWGEGKAGVEEQDFLLMAAPKPILILSATQDFFNIDGARKAYNELKREYEVLGYPDRIKQIIAEGEHGWHKPMREAAVQWCKRWLMNDNKPVVEPEDIGFFKNQSEFQVTKTGQVLTSFENERSVSDINRERLKKCKTNREQFLSKKSRGEIITGIKKVIGFENLAENPKYELTGSFNRNNYKVEKYLIERDVNFKFDLPALLFIPQKDNTNSSTIIIVSDSGKISALKDDDRIQNEINKGNKVLALDVCNTGELKDTVTVENNKYDNAEFLIAKLPLYEGKSLMTYRIEDILLAKRFLEIKSNTQGNKFELVSFGSTGPAALHAAVIDGNFKSVTIINSIKKWEDIASADYSSEQIANIVPDVLNFYDLPDLQKLVPGTVVKIVNPVEAEKGKL